MWGKRLMYSDSFLLIPIHTYGVLKVTHSQRAAGKSCEICENTAFDIHAKHLSRLIWIVWSHTTWDHILAPI